MCLCDTAKKQAHIHTSRNDIRPTRAVTLTRYAYACIRNTCIRSLFLSLSLSPSLPLSGNEALREAKTLQGLSHHNVVRYNDVFLHMDGGLLQVCTIINMKTRTRTAHARTHTHTHTYHDSFLCLACLIHVHDNSHTNVS